MAITIHVGSDLFERDPEPYAVFWKAIIYYLDDLKEDFDLKKLVNCDPYGEVVFSLEYCKLLNEELPGFLKLVTELP